MDQRPSRPEHDVREPAADLSHDAAAGDLVDILHADVHEFLDFDWGIGNQVSEGGNQTADPEIDPILTTNGDATQYCEPSRIHQEIRPRKRKSTSAPVALKTYTCEDRKCREEFFNLKKYGDHMSQEHGLKAFRCEKDCDAAFSRVDALRKHVCRSPSRRLEPSSRSPSTSTSSASVSPTGSPPEPKRKRPRTRVNIKSPGIALGFQRPRTVEDTSDNTSQETQLEMGGTRRSPRFDSSRSRRSTTGNDGAPLAAASGHRHQEMVAHHVGITGSSTPPTAPIDLENEYKGNKSSPLDPGPLARPDGGSATTLRDLESRFRAKIESLQSEIEVLHQRNCEVEKEKREMSRRIWWMQMEIHKANPAHHR
ncbi:hypothetical protein TWF481_011734 [Arthrobotrys musiformis]|uniref:C2H2-type domain-containing protein n=1 Tax=Arthrobotrys musiformis TaxID=47236 RepID=A0AAV9VZA3_9PEZI